MDYLVVSPAMSSLVWSKNVKKDHVDSKVPPLNNQFSFFFFRTSQYFVLSNVRARPMHDAVFSRRSTRWLEFYIR